MVFGAWASCLVSSNGWTVIIDVDVLSGYSLLSLAPTRNDSGMVDHAEFDGTTGLDLPLHLFECRVLLVQHRVKIAFCKVLICVALIFEGGAVFSLYLH